MCLGTQHDWLCTQLWLDVCLSVKKKKKMSVICYVFLCLLYSKTSYLLLCFPSIEIKYEKQLCMFMNDIYNQIFTPSPPPPKKKQTTTTTTTKQSTQNYNSWPIVPASPMKNCSASETIHSSHPSCLQLPRWFLFWLDPQNGNKLEFLLFLKYASVSRCRTTAPTPHQ